MRRDELKWIYGTAWKEEATAGLTRQAIGAGFRAIDTANQRKHYLEAAVGQAVSEAVAGGLARDDLFLQTKFTHRGGQDHRLPYDEAAPIAAQVEQSFASSLDHLGVSHVDSYLLHGPQRHEGLSAGDWEAYRAMERLQEGGKALEIGISNVTLEQLEELCARATVKPGYVQNRCYASRGWDRGVRAYCAGHGITYQAFSLLTANREVLAHPTVRAIAAGTKRTPSQVVFRFAIQAGMVAMTGTTSPVHMTEDLSILPWELSGDEVKKIEALFG